MKKRTGIIIVALIAAFTLLAATAYANVPAYEGYEAMKTLLQKDGNHDKPENATIEGDLKVTDNGETIFQMDALLKSEDEDGKGSGYINFTANGESKSLEVYSDGNEVYVFDLTEGNYYVADKDEMENMDEEEDTYHSSRKGDDYDRGDLTAAQEELLDFVVGDLKDDFEVEYHSDGSQTIDFEMTKEEMPMLLNLIVSAMDSEGRRGYEEEDFEPSQELLDKYPILNDFVDMDVEHVNLVEDRELEYVDFSLTSDKDGSPTAIAFDMIATGNDEDGVYHEVQVTGSFNLTEIGTTVMDTPELEGKDLIEIDSADFEEFHQEGNYGRQKRR